MQIQQRPGQQLGDAATLAHAGLRARLRVVTKRTLEASLYELNLRLADQRPQQAGQETGVKAIGVGVEVGDDVALHDPQRAPHRIALALGRAILARDRVLLHDRQAGGGGNLGRPIDRGRIDQERLIDQPHLSQIHDAARDRADRPRDLTRREDDRDRIALGGEQTLQRKLLGLEAAPCPPVGHSQIMR